MTTGARTRKAGVAPADHKVLDDPVVENDGPVVENDGPVVEKDGPVVEKDGPVVEKDGPVAERGGAEQALAASQADLAKLRLVRRARLIKAAILTFIALILITFVLQNAHPVGVQLAFWTVSVGLIWVIVASVLLGAVAGYLVGRPDKELLLHGPSRRQEDPR